MTEFETEMYRIQNDFVKNVETTLNRRGVLTDTKLIESIILDYAILKKEEEIAMKKDSPELFD
ncbi:hypothetical protein [Enterococcus sp. HY326]|uniref:hypothetical protein n=1 Tax=Enterococcus sp. HY326 TaxID=2971265 RepID=UPI00223FB519|nr:hypothetical protein [Enterococcus sp. HY326]